MIKRNKYYLAFSDDWFSKHQTRLLFILNDILLGKALRAALRIHKKDRIIKITSSSVHFISGNGAEAYLYPRRYFSKKIYESFKSIWWLLHWWDELFADRFAEELSFGLSTLIAYPDDDPETTTVDGWIKSYSDKATWSDLHDGLESLQANDSGNTILASILCAGSTNEWVHIIRSMLLFDTSTLGSGATINSAAINIYTIAPVNDFSSSTYVMIVSSNPNSNTGLSTGDWSDFGTTNFGYIDLASINSGGYSQFNLNSSGIANINKTGVSKFGVRLRWDVDDSPPTWGANDEATMQGASADYGSYPPYLYIDYTPEYSNISGSSSIRFDLEPTLRGRANGISTTELNFSINAIFVGYGSLSSNIVFDFDTAESDLTGIGNMSSQVGIAFEASGVLSGSAYVDSAINLELDVSGIVIATGNIDSLLELVFSNSGELIGYCYPESTINLEFDLAAELLANALIESGITLVFDLAGETLGFGDISSTIGITFDVDCNINADGKMSSAMSLTFSVTPDIAANGYITSQLTLDLDIISNLGGFAEIESAIELLFAAYCELVGNGNIDSETSITFNVVAIQSGIYNIRSVIYLEFDIAGVLPASGLMSSAITLTFDNTGNAYGSGLVASLTFLNFDVIGITAASGQMSSSMNLTFDLQSNINAPGSLIGSTDLTFSVVGIQGGFINASSTIELTFDINAILPASGNMTSGITLTFDVDGLLVASGLLSGSTDITFDLVGITSAPGQIRSLINLDFAVSGGLNGVGLLASGITLDFDLSGGCSGYGLMIAETNLTFTLFGEIEIAPSNISSLMLISFDCTGELPAVGNMSSRIFLIFGCNVNKPQNITIDDIIKDNSLFANVARKSSQVYSIVVDVVEF